MKRKFLAIPLASFAAMLSSGCMSVFLVGAPTGISFDEPPPRESVDPFPRETLVGSWSGKAVMDLFVDGRRITVDAISDEVVFREDGTCSHAETHTIVENALGGGYGPNRSQETQIVCEGTWKYENGILDMDMIRGDTGMKFKWLFTPVWFSDEEILLDETDEQAVKNAKATGSGLGWDTRTKAPNGVQTLTKKGIPLVSPEQRIVLSPMYLKRTGDAED
jgi:hypothetical protein